MKGTRNSILNIKEYIDNGENLKIKPVDLNLKNECIAYSLELPLGILSYFGDNISSDMEINYYILSGVKRNKCGMPQFLGFFKQLKEEGNIKSDNTDEILPKYKELNKKELIYMMIFETKVKEIEELKLNEFIRQFKLLYEKGLEIDEITAMEIRRGKLETPETTIIRIEKLIIP